MAAVKMGGLPGAVVSGTASGLILMIVIWTFASVSGGHVNPAVSLVLGVMGLFQMRLVPGHIIAQLAGSAAAGLYLAACLGDIADMGANLPNTALGIGPATALGIEIVLSFVMMLVTMGSIHAEGGLPSFAPIPIGAIVGSEVLVFGGIAGAAMNPARAFGPYLALGHWDAFWIYAIGPFFGIFLGGILGRLIWSVHRD